MSDLAAMYGGSPNTASMMMGQNQFDDRNRKAAELQALFQQNQQAAAMDPLKQQMMQGQIATQQAQLPGQVGASQSLAAQGQFDQETGPAKIAAKFSAMADQMGEEGMKGLAREGEVYRTASAMMAKYPVAAHKQILAQFAQRYGSTNSPILQNLMKVKDDELMKGLDELGTGMAMASEKFVTQRALNSDNNASRERQHKMDNEAKLEAERIKGDARKESAKMRLKEAGALTPDKAIAKLEMVPEDERTPDEWKALQKLQAYMLTKAAAGANATTPGVLGMDSPMASAQKAAAALTPNQQAAAPQAPAGGDISAIAKQQDLAYEPDKYHYRVVNGKLQRAPK